MNQHIGAGAGGDPAWYWPIVVLGQKMLIVLAKFVALLIFIGMHNILDWAMGNTLPSDWPKTKKVLEAIVAVPFVLLYVDQVIEMLAVFFPRLGTLHARFTRGHTTQG